MREQFLELVRDREEICRLMKAEVPKHLGNPRLTLEEATQLYQALEKQAQATERLIELLEEQNADDDLIAMAEAADNFLSDVAALAAERMIELRK